MNENQRAVDPVREWLGAYHDGELTAERRAWVEAHLNGCAACREDLAGLRALSSLLGSLPEPAMEREPEAFTAEVLRRLPGRSEPGGSKWLRAGWRYAPVALFAGWAFFQALVWAAGLLALALPFLPGGAALAQALQPAADFATGGLLAQLGDTITQAAGLPEILAVQWRLALVSVLFAAAFSVLFFSWLAASWSQHRAQQQV
jgi:anti-sigma factor RsiW